jgi:hypothetical protein
MKRHIRLLAVDIDGTLLDTRFEVSAANREAVVAAHRRGIEIVLVTGRRYASAWKIAAQLPVQMTLISSGGAMVKDARGTTLHRHLLPAAKARQVLADAGAGRRSALLLFDREGKGQVVTESLDPSHEPVEGYFLRNREYLEQVVPLEAALIEDPIEVLFVGAVAPMRELERRLAQAPSASGVSLALTEYPSRDLSLVDVLDRGCNKGAALAWWAEQRGVAREEVMAIGDNWNDREMLEFAGLPVLMGNSSEELKQAGWAVTTSNDDSGVAAAIECFLLKDYI